MIREVERFEATSADGKFRTSIVVLRSDDTGAYSWQTYSGQDVTRTGEGTYEISTPWGITPTQTVHRSREAR